MENECFLVKKNLGLGNCPTMPKYYKSMFWTPLGFKIPAATIAQGAAAVIAFLQASMLAPKAERIYKFPTFFDNTDESQETVYQQTVLGKREVDPGYYEYLINFSDSLCLHKAIRTHKTNTGRLIWLDKSNQLIGTSPGETGDFYGQTIQMLNPEKMKGNTGTEVAMSPVRVVLEDNLELDLEGAILSVPGIGALVPLTDVKLTIQSAADDEIVVAATVACDGSAVTGLEPGDFLALDALGDEQTISGVTEGEDGIYTLTGTFETGTLNLAAAADLSIPGFEGTAVTLTVAS